LKRTAFFLAVKTHAKIELNRAIFIYEISEKKPLNKLASRLFPSPCRTLVLKALCGYYAGVAPALGAGRAALLALCGGRAWPRAVRPRAHPST
jgi:hypothetical protein